MKKILYTIGAILTLGFTSCEDDKTQSYVIECDYVDELEDNKISVPTEQKSYIKNYLETNGLTAIEHEEEFFYTIIEAGEDTKLERCYNAVTNFKIFTFSGDYIDFGNEATFALYDTGVILGLRMGLTTIGQKGKVTLYVPPALAYGEKGADPAIGPNEYLIIEIELVSATKRMTYY